MNCTLIATLAQVNPNGMVSIQELMKIINFDLRYPILPSRDPAVLAEAAQLRLSLGMPPQRAPALSVNPVPPVKNVVAATPETPATPPIPPDDAQ